MTNEQRAEEYERKIRLQTEDLMKECKCTYDEARTAVINALQECNALFDRECI